MKDRFKVRAWNNRTKEYVNEKGINTIYKGAYNATMLLGLFQYLKNDKQIQAIVKDFEFEQCTGLKDKYGNLIYEGDIVCDNEYHLEVKEQNGGFIVTNGAVDEMLYLDLKEYEIIGNIHEDPELLEVK